MYRCTRFLPGICADREGDGTRNGGDRVSGTENSTSAKHVQVQTRSLITLAVNKTRSHGRDKKSETVLCDLG
jgi:hypothetical protein